MISIATEMTQISKLFRAAENNDIRELYKLFTENPYLLHGGGLLSWGENPLHVACKSGTLQFVAAVSGHVEIVKALAEFDSRLCLTEDLDSIILLHVAAICGREDVVRTLVVACPESLQKTTSNRETALHLSLKYSESGVFRVLMEELKKFKLEELLNGKDYEGNTVLHIATSHKLIKLLELLLIANSSTNAPFVDVNSMNERGYTALDVHNETSNDLIAREVWLILLDAGAVKRRLLSVSEAPERRSSKIPIKVINLLLMVFITAATILFAASCNPPNAIQLPNETATVSIWDMVIGPSHFQVIFVYMICSMVGFIVSMGVILVLLWPLPYRAVTTFVLAILVVVYILVVGINMPKFSVIMGSSRIASGIFMGFSAGIFILCGFTALILGKLCGCFNQITCEEVACGDLLV